MDCSLPGSSVHGIFQVRMLEWVVISSSRGYSWLRNQTCVSWVSCIVVWFFTAEPPGEALKRDLDKHKDVQAGFRKGRETRDQIANICWIMEKAREFQKNIYFCFIDYAKGFDCVDHNKLWKILQEMGIPDHLTCLLRNLYAGQEAQLELDMEQQTGSK